MNNIKIVIDNVDYSKYVVSPLKMGDLLDEQLDEVNVTLKYINKEYFEPLTSVKIVIKNKPEAAASKEMLDDILSRSDYEFTGNTSTDGHLTAYEQGVGIEQYYTKCFIVASDNAVEVPAGSGRFIHELYLIERTKIMEGFIGDSLTFTNPTEKTRAKPYSFFYGNYTNQSSSFNVDSQITGSNFFKSPITNGELLLPGITPVNGKQPEFAQLFFDDIENNHSSEVIPRPTKVVTFFWEVATPLLGSVLQERTVIDGNGNEVYKGTVTTEENNGEICFRIKEVLNGTTIVTELVDGDNPAYLLRDRIISLSEGIYEVKCSFFSTDANETNAIKISTSNCYVTVASAAGAPPKRWTIKDVVNRICDTLEPNRSENRFSFDEAQAEKYDKIIAPEFTFTDMNLREMLRQIGGFIHAEPRLKDDTESNVIMFDEYGGFNKSKIGERKNYIGYQLKSDINEWCTSIDSSAQNLVNQLDYASGTAYEPTQSYVNGRWGALGTSLRTETVTARFLQDDSTVIPTYLPIYQIKKLYCVFILGEGNVQIDITPYVYESADYNGLLKSNNGMYPYAKACAVYYTQGEKNIKGLFYKETDAISQYLSDFSILNILRAASGDQSISISGVDYFFLNFVIEYVPIYSTRIRSIKPTLRTGVTPRTIAYNQDSNLIETKYYGENLKGVVARLGNIEKTYTYNLCYLSDIPKVGYLFDDNYYISAVYTEVLPTYIKCTIGLSKDFNRLSQYVGISSNRRMWEVSEKQSQKRQSVHTEYLKITQNRNVKSDENICFQGLEDFLYSSKTLNISSAEVTTKRKDKTTIATLLMPCVASSFGNSIVFTFEFADNYSAGEKMIEGIVDGAYALFGQYVPYGDYFGKFYYADIVFESYAVAEYKNWNGNTLPEYQGGVTYYDRSIVIKDWKYRKDNREIPQISYELAAYSDEEALIVGSALMSNSPFVRQTSKAIALYGLTHKLNKLSQSLDVSELMDSNKISMITELNTSYDTENRKLTLTLPITSKTKDIYKYKSFAIVTYPGTEEIDVSDDNGNVVKQTIQKGGELVLGFNKTYEQFISKTESGNPKIYFAVKKSI